MDVLRYLIPVSLALGGLGLAAFFWTLRSNQYEDPEGDSRRILTDDYDDAPKADPARNTPTESDADKRTD
jgi:cbb3-type cytochrome oxidase maturation protein